jgi:hypothetical protein
VIWELVNCPERILRNPRFLGLLMERVLRILERDRELRTIMELNSRLKRRKCSPKSL